MAFGQVPHTDIVVFDILWNDRGRPELHNPLRVTDRAAYDNQPSFHPDGSGLLYTSMQGQQTDIYYYNLADSATRALTKTVESEYSPQVMGDGRFFSVVRVELPDSAQRLWRFPLVDISGELGKPRLMMDQVDGIGYYSWINQGQLALFILPGREGRQTLQVCHANKQRTWIVAAGIGRCIQSIPGKEAVSFTVDMGSDRDRLKRYDHKTRAVSDLGQALPESQDYVWTPDGKILMGAGERLYFLDPEDEAGGDGRWHLGFDLAGYLNGMGFSSFDRMAISPDGERLAVVMTRVADAAEAEQ